MTIAAPPVSVPFAPPSIGSAEIAEVIATLESGWLSTGPRVARFEEAFRRYTGARHAIALNSCTAGLHLSLLAAGIGAGDEVITTPLTFCATANVIVHAGATPVFADIDPATGTIDPARVEAAITPRTRAILAVHYGGRPADVVALGALARARGLITIEDAAHCIEGRTPAGRVGTTADFTVFSFYATKNLTTGEGGMVTTGSDAAADYIRQASLHGLTRDAWTRYRRAEPARYDVLTPGFKYNMTDLQAAIGLHQLAALDERLARRRALAQRYDRAFADLPLDRFAPVPPGVAEAHHLYTIQISARAGLTRDEAAAALARAGIATSVHFQPVHLLRYYAGRFDFLRGQFPHAEAVADRVLSLPFSAALTDDQADLVIDAVRQVLGARP